MHILYNFIYMQTKSVVFQEWNLDRTCYKRVQKRIFWNDENCLFFVAFAALDVRKLQQSFIYGRVKILDKSKLRKESFFGLQFEGNQSVMVWKAQRWGGEAARPIALQSGSREKKWVSVYPPHAGQDPSLDYVSAHIQGRVPPPAPTAKPLWKRPPQMYLKVCFHGDSKAIKSQAWQLVPVIQFWKGRQACPWGLVASESC